MGAAHFTRIASSALPVSSSPPGFLAATDDVANLIVAEARGTGAVHVTVDGDGAMTSHAHSFPISPLSICACGDGVVVAGVRAADGARGAMSVRADGSIDWECALPAPADELVWMAAACVAGEPVIAWGVEANGAGTLHIAKHRAGSLVSSPPIASSRVAYGMSTASAGASLYVLRHRGAERAGEVLRVVDGALVARAEVAKNAQAIAIVGERVAVLSWTPATLVLEWLDLSLAAISETDVIATANPPSWIRFATLCAAGEDRIAVSYLVGDAAELQCMPSGRSELTESARHIIARYDVPSRSLVDATELAPAGSAWSSAAWIGRRLLVLHGELSATLSAFGWD